MKTTILIVLLSCSFFSCKKYLEAKPDLKLQLPDNINTTQALLDNETTMVMNNPVTGEASADNYYLTDATWAALSSEAQRNMYIWGADITLSEYPNHWSKIYDVVTISNVVLQSINAITPQVNEQLPWNNVKGSALLFRAKAFLAAISLWAKPYDKNTAATDPGIPLRLDADYETVSVRQSVQSCYDQVISDLKESAVLLPSSPQHVIRPSRPAAYALLARTFLSMGLFDSAGIYADKCLAISSALINYNTLTGSLSYPIPLFNAEVIMHATASTPALLSNSRARVDSVLYLSYVPNDLRKVIFFKSNGNGSYAFKGSYAQSATLFNGIATDEIWLIKAECLARAGKITDAMATLNSLLITRWKTGTFIPLVASDATAALSLILSERRKELIFRDIRWTDLKRLNMEPAWQQAIYRKLASVEYKLVPGDNRFALPIPASVIAMSSITQNPR